VVHGYLGPLGLFPFGLLGGLAGLLFVAGIVVLAVWLFREIATPSAAHGPSAVGRPQEAPLEILSRRFAAGEINAEEFQKARDLLRQG
jgi:uncharacterized membrane protein